MKTYNVCNLGSSFHLLYEYIICNSEFPVYLYHTFFVDDNSDHQQLKIVFEFRELGRLGRRPLSWERLMIPGSELQPGLVFRSGPVC